MSDPALRAELAEIESRLLISDLNESARVLRELDTSIAERSLHIVAGRHERTYAGHRAPDPEAPRDARG